MNLRKIARIALAFVAIAAFGIVATGADIVPEGDLPVLGITASGID